MKRLKIMKSYNLQWYVDKLKNGEQFSLARYGDGEMLCMWGKQGENSNGCRYSPELREALLDSMKYKHDPSFIYGMQRVLPKDRERIEKEYPDIDWYDTEIFSEAVANGDLYPLIEQLRKMKVVIIGNKSLEPIRDLLKSTSVLWEVPPSNAFEEESRLFSYFMNSNPHWENTIYIFSCGMAANAFISKWHQERYRWKGKKFWLIDLGHIWDPFVGLMSRCDLEGKTKEDIEKNLHDR